MNLSKLKISFDEIFKPIRNAVRRFKWYSKFDNAEVYFTNMDPPREWDISIGEGTVGDYLLLYGKEGDRLNIGKRCIISHNSALITSRRTHEFGKPNKPGKESKKDSGNFIEIGDDVWIGYNATILSNVKIGNGAVIGACSVVTHDVEANSVVAGNPAVLIKRTKKAK